jgi:hypothetical protein
MVGSLLADALTVSPCGAQRTHGAAWALWQQCQIIGAGTDCQLVDMHADAVTDVAQCLRNELLRFAHDLRPKPTE